MGGAATHSQDFTFSQTPNSSPRRPRPHPRPGIHQFSQGSAVEVQTDEEDFRGVYFSATVIQPPIPYTSKHGGKRRPKSIYVEYHNLLAHENGSERLKEYVGLEFVRPVPPSAPTVEPFEPGDVVDAFYKDGWWTGVVKRAVEGSEKYVVTFQYPPDELEFAASDLRVHWDWVKGTWVRPQKQDVPIQSSDVSINKQRASENFSTTAIAVPLNSVSEKDTCGQITLYSQTTGEGHTHEISPDDPKASDVVGAPNKLTNDSSSKDTVWDSVSVSEANISIPATQTVTMDHLSDNPSGGKRIRRKQRNSDATGSVVKNIDSTPNPMNLTGVQMLQHGSPNHNAGGKELDSVGNTANIQTENAKNDTELPVIIGLPCAEMGSSECGTMGKRGHLSNSKEMINLTSDKNQQLNDSVVQKLKDNKPLETGDSSERKRRGRPRKSSLEGLQTLVSGNAQNEVVGSDDLNKKSDDPHKIPEVEVMEMNASLPNLEVLLNENELPDEHFDPKNEKGRKKKRILSRPLDEKVVKKSPRLQGTNSSRRGRKLIQGGKVALQFLDSPDASGGTVKEANHTVESENAVCEVPNNELDDEPLSKWIEGMHASSLIDGSRLSHVSAVDQVQCMENGKEKGDDIALEDDIVQFTESGAGASTFADTHSIGQNEPQNLPFVKNAFLWKTIESMDVFQRIPQKPHFKPLENFKESSREGMAIGHMVTFSSVVEKTSRLQFDDPKCVIDDILETLVELERHGFEVKIVEDRVNELFAVKEKREKLMDEVKVMDEQMLEQNQERSRIEEEIKGINEDMRKLQEKLSLAESAQEKQDGEIASLQTRLKETKEIIENMGSEFDSIASSTLAKV